MTPDTVRTFDIELAKQKLDDAGYKLNASGQRLDKEGKPINLRLYMPDSDANYPKAAQFINDWYGQLGIKVTTAGSTTPATLGTRSSCRAGDLRKADYDIELWGWSGNPDPNALMQIFECSAIGSSSDSQYCNPAYDKLYEQQLVAPAVDARIGDRGPDAEHDLRRGAVRHPLLRRQPGCVEDRSLRGLAAAAGERDAALHPRNPGLHALTSAAAQPSPPSHRRRGPSPRQGRRRSCGPGDADPQRRDGPRGRAEARIP